MAQPAVVRGAVGVAASAGVAMRASRPPVSSETRELRFIVFTSVAWRPHRRGIDPSPLSSVAAPRAEAELDGSGRFGVARGSRDAEQVPMTLSEARARARRPSLCRPRSSDPHTIPRPSSCSRPHGRARARRSIVASSSSKGSSPSRSPRWRSRWPCSCRATARFDVGDERGADPALRRRATGRLRDRDRIHVPGDPRAGADAVPHAGAARAGACRRRAAGRRAAVSARAGAGGARERCWPSACRGTRSGPRSSSSPPG